MKQWFYYEEGKQTGPVSEDRLIQMFKSGQLQVDTYVWTEGMKDWRPAGDFEKFIPEKLTLPPPTKAPPTPPAQQHITDISLTGDYPGFWLRFVAHCIDSIISYILSFIAGVMIGFMFGLVGQIDDTVLKPLGALAGIAASWLYYALMESSTKQATLGKMVCGFIVTDLQGQKISFGKATGRCFGMIVSCFILCIGFMMCAWTERKQCLHDMMAGCLMLKK